jgi:hypothetical protein
LIKRKNLKVEAKKVDGHGEDIEMIKTDRLTREPRNHIKGKIDIKEIECDNQCKIIWKGEDI